MIGLRRLTPGRIRRAIAARKDLLSSRNLPEVESAARPPRSDRVFDPLKAGRRLRVLLAYVHHDYGMRRRGISYETTAFRDPLHHLGCDVVEAPLDIWKQRLGLPGIAGCLLETAFRNDVDVVFAIPFTDEIAPQTLGEIRDRLGIPVMAWFCDDQWRFDGFTRRFLPYVDVAVTTYAGAVARYHAAGFSQVLRSQWAANHRIFRPLRAPLRYDLSFIGQPHSDRPELVRRLRSTGLRVETRGFGWPEGRASLREMVEISNQSKICLNFSNASSGRLNQVKGRDFEIPAMGRLLLTASSEEIREYFTEDEVVTYQTPDELVDQARELLRDDARREAIAQAGYARLLRDHTAEARLAQIFSESAVRGWLAA